VFARRRGGPEAPDLVIGKRYDTFTLERVRRRRPLLQVVLRAANGNRLVFEFRRHQRELAGELIARLTPPRLTKPDGAPDGAPGDAADGGTTRAPSTGEEPADTNEDTVFWGSRQ